MASTTDTQSSALATQLDNLNVADLGPSARVQLLHATRKLAQRLETPWDAIGRMFWTEPAVLMATKIAIDMDLFQHFEACDSTAGHVELSKLTKADAFLTKRVLRVLGSNGVLDEVDVDQYSMNALSKTLLTQEASDTITFLVEVQMPCDIGVPKWIREHDFQNPSGPDDCPWKDAMRTDLGYFQWLKANPQHLREFGGLMKGFNQSRIPWTDFFPITDLLDGDIASPFMVDVGGGVGHDLQQVLDKLPSVAGRLHLQDLPEVVASAPVPEPQISKAAHDFFTPQPVAGARIYFLHSILHDWPDVKARDILLQLVPALKKGYSKILLLESAIAQRNPMPASTGVDLLMMSLFGAQERDEATWRALFESVGLALTKIWRSPAGGQAILEVDLA